MMKEKADRKQNFVRYNEQIRIPRIRVIHEGKNLGEMQTKEALALARSEGLE